MTALPRRGRDPDDRRSRQAARAVAVIVIATAVKLAVFAALERPWGCDCGRIWAMPGDPALNSQTLLGPYSLLHAVTGALLVLLVTRLRPDLGLWALLAVVVASSTTWEVIENLPVSIRLFGYDAADPLAYHGDSRLNAFADTACAVARALFARVASARVVLALAVGTEIALSPWIQDGFVIAAIRALQQAL
ncbi:DUF2585 family protein (plasmid) [Paracoccus marcusii]|uniref:DUF2585 family protein n=1 Tax=Paracoccus marcusii TaxID=59779 RepID=UPI002ED6606E|nr:DUF2585 family protein [Paracoccus marcusii]